MLAALISFQLRSRCGCACDAYVLVYMCTHVCTCECVRGAQNKSAHYRRTREGQKRAQLACMHASGTPACRAHRFSFRARGRAARLHARLHARQLLVTRRCSYARSRRCTEQEYTLPEKQRRAKTRTSNRCSRCVAVALMTKQTHLSVLFKADAIWCCACHVFGYMTCRIISYSITWYSMISQEEYDIW